MQVYRDNGIEFNDECNDAGFDARRHGVRESCRRYGREKLTVSGGGRQADVL